MFGTDISRIFDAKKTYKGFLSSTKKNDLFREALTLCIEDVYKNLQGQDSYDLMIKILKLNQEFSLNNNKIYCMPLDVTNIVYSGAGTDFTVTTALPHNAIVGDTVTFTGILNFTTPITGSYTVTAFITPTATSFSISSAFTGGTYTAGTGQMTTTKMIPDYNHLLAVKTKYVRNIDVKISDITNTSPIRYTINKKNNDIKTGELISITGIIGNTNANGNLYVKKVSNIKFDTYYDKDLTIPTSGNGTYQGAAKLQRVYYKFATPYFSTEKGSIYEMPSIREPKFERGNGQLIFHPLDYTCEQITADYISSNIVQIDCTDSKVDLLDSYAEDFLYLVLGRSLQLFADRFSDQGLQQSAMIEQKQITQ